MGTSRTPEEFVAKIRKAAEGIEKSRHAGMRSAVAQAKAIFIAERDRAAPGGVLRHAGRKGKPGRINISYTLSESGGYDRGLIRATGPWGLIEDKTPAHTIGTGRSKKGSVGIPSKARRNATTGKVNGPKRIRFANGDIRTTVRHPGTRGKHPFSIGRARVIAELPPKVARETWKPVMEAFR